MIPGSASFPAKYGDHVIRTPGNPGAPQTISPTEKAELARLMKSRVKSGIAENADEYDVCFYSCTSDRHAGLIEEGRLIRLFGGSGHSFKWGALFAELISDVLDHERNGYKVSEIVSSRATP